VEAEIAEFLPSVYNELIDLSKEDIIKRFTSLEFNHLLDYYRGAPDLNQSKAAETDYGVERFTTGDRMFINLGKMDGLDKGRLLSLVCDRSGVKGKDIGKIDVKGAYSFFEVDSTVSEAVRQHLHGFEYKGRIVRIELTGERSAQPKERREKKRGGYEKRPYEKKSFEKKSYEKKGYEKKSFEKKSFSKPKTQEKKGDDSWFDKKINNLNK
jgi:ATP-dependent RNA helicase DeaD